MNKIVKKAIKKTLQHAKKAANSNRYTKKAAQDGKRLLSRALLRVDQREVYNISSFYPTIQDYAKQQKDFDTKKDPLISILLPTYNTPEIFLRDCIESIMIQSYPNWELCIADDKSPDKQVIKIIKEYQSQDSRIKLVERKQNGHISDATNSALAIAKGDFVALMDHDDVLWPNTLYEIVQVIRKNNNVDFIYTDEDKIDGTGKIHSYPFLKPDFSPEFLESCNYITHFSCVRTSIIKKIGGFRKGYEGAQDWDLFIRVSEVTSSIIHIPKILYSWRIHEASTASDTDAKPYVYEAQRKLLVDHITRQNKEGTVETGIIRQHRTIHYSLKQDSLLTVIIDYTDELKTEKTIRSLLSHDAGHSYELIVGSNEPISKLKKDKITRLDKKVKFLISTGSVSEEAAKQAAGSSILYIKDGVEITSEDWAQITLADTQIEGVAFVFPVILDESKSIVLSSGIGLGYGDNKAANMLQGMPFDDPHYTRGLYAKSRRNVSAGNSSVYAVKTGLLIKDRNFNDNADFVSLCLDFVKQGYRHIYTPYLQAVGEKRLIDKFYDIDLKPGYEDIYLNPNFNHDNERMEVRA